MINSRRQLYHVYLNIASIGPIKAADAVLIEEAKVLTVFGFRYAAEYLQHPSAFPLDPVHLPLTSQEIKLHCNGGTPGLLDDYLPDAWGRKVLSHLAFYRDHKKVDHRSCIDMLSYIGDSRIGALQWVLPGEQPKFSNGTPIESLANAELAAKNVDDGIFTSAQVDEISLLYLANAGTGVGGARPKTLINQNGKAYLAKFNRLGKDEYNNARVELACLNMARAAGIFSGEGYVTEGVNGRDVLMLERFDISPEHTRHHLITVNALLKTTTQADRGGTFRYDDIADLIRQFSTHPEQDLNQLVRVMLFNRGINNIDDHERNFSFIHRGQDYQLAPAYDMVPSLTSGAYHVAGFRYQPSPPTASEIGQLGKVFGLPKTHIVNAAEQVIAALKLWQTFAAEVGVSDEETAKIQSVLRY